VIARSLSVIGRQICPQSQARGRPPLPLGSGPSSSERPAFRMSRGSKGTSDDNVLILKIGPGVASLAAATFIRSFARHRGPNAHERRQIRANQGWRNSLNLNERPAHQSGKPTAARSSRTAKGRRSACAELTSSPPQARAAPAFQDKSALLLRGESWEARNGGRTSAVWRLTAREARPRNLVC
jgi:hypothetical protein